MNADHTRLQEIEARLEAAKESERPLVSRWQGDGGTMEQITVWRHSEADLRYLLDRVRAQSARIEALEAAVRRTWSVRARDDSFYCGVCGNMADHTAENIHAPSCIVPTLPAPEYGHIQ